MNRNNGVHGVSQQTSTQSTHYIYNSPNKNLSPKPHSLRDLCLSLKILPFFTPVHSDLHTRTTSRTVFHNGSPFERFFRKYRLKGQTVSRR